MTLLRITSTYIKFNWNSRNKIWWKTGQKLVDLEISLILMIVTIPVYYFFLILMKRQIICAWGRQKAYICCGLSEN